MTETTSTSFKPTVSAEEHEVIDATGARIFRGWELAFVTTQIPTSLHWTTMTLYRNENPEATARYILQITGQSVIFHALNSDCNLGVPTLRANLPRGARPCTECDWDGADPLTVEFEDDLNTVYECGTAQEVVQQLTRNKRGPDGGVAPGAGKVNAKSLSRPALRLLQTAANVDGAFDPRSMPINL